MPPGATPEVQAQIRHANGLDRPLLAQYLDFVAGAMRGDFGDSWRQGRPALTAVLERLPATLTLTTLAIALAVVIGAPLGSGGGASGISLGWRSAAHCAPRSSSPRVLARHDADPLLRGRPRLGPFLRALRTRQLRAARAVPRCVPAATLTRLLRAAMIETLGADYIRTARAKGLPRSRILVGHALRNAALPAIAFTGLQAGFLLGGAVIVEGVFAFPGIGGLALDAVATRDIPLVGGLRLGGSGPHLAVNLVTDAIAAALDPRLRQIGGTARGAA